MYPSFIRDARVDIYTPCQAWSNSLRIRIHWRPTYLIHQCGVRSLASFRSVKNQRWIFERVSQSRAGCKGKTAVRLLQSIINIYRSANNAWYSIASKSLCAQILLINSCWFKTRLVYLEISRVWEYTITSLILQPTTLDLKYTWDQEHTNFCRWRLFVLLIAGRRIFIPHRAISYDVIHLRVRWLHRLPLSTGEKRRSKASSRYRNDRVYGFILRQRHHRSCYSAMQFSSWLAHSGGQLIRQRCMEIGDNVVPIKVVTTLRLRWMTRYPAGWYGSWQMSSLLYCTNIAESWNIPIPTNVR